MMAARETPCVSISATQRSASASGESGSSQPRWRMASAVATPRCAASAPKNAGEKKWTWASQITGVL